MAKGMVFVVICTVLLMILFCVCCYLMTTINPMPVTSGKYPQGSPPIEVTPEAILRFGIERAEAGLKSAYDMGIVLRNLEGDIATDPNYLYFVSHKRNKSTVHPPKHFDLRHKSKEVIQEQLVNSNKVSVPVFKKGKRRSVSVITNSKIEPKFGAVILKIVDESGHTKIEIKVEPDAFNEADVNSEEKTQINKREYINRDTVITILPNNSLSLDKPDQSVVFIDFASKNTNVSKQDNERKSMLTRTESFTPSLLLQTLKNDKLVIYSVTNSTEDYITKSPQETI